MAKKIRSLALLLLLAFFTYLLLKITLQYIPFNSDVAFLRIKQHYVDVPFYLTSFYTHVYTAIFCVLAGFTQFIRIRKGKIKSIHKYMGWMYIIVVLVLASPSGLYIGIYANGGSSSVIAFVLLAILWFIFTLISFIKLRQRNFIAHRNFMIRSYALTLSAITLRAWKYVLVAIFHPRPMDVYMVVAWLAWTLNLSVAEFIIYRQKKRHV